MLEVGGLIGGELQHGQRMRRLLRQGRHAAISDEARIEPGAAQHVMDEAGRRRLALRAGDRNGRGVRILLEPEIGDGGEIDAAPLRFLHLRPIRTDAGALDHHIEGAGAQRGSRLRADEHAPLAERRQSAWRKRRVVQDRDGHVGTMRSHIVERRRALASRAPNGDGFSFRRDRHGEVSHSEAAGCDRARA